MVYRARAKLLVLAWANEWRAVITEAVVHAVNTTPDVCYVEAAAKVDRLHQRLWREWPGRPFVRSKMYITEAPQDTQERMVQRSCANFHGSNRPEFN